MFIVAFQRGNNFLIRAKLRNPSQNNILAPLMLFSNETAIVLHAPAYPTYQTYHPTCPTGLRLTHSTRQTKEDVLGTIHILE